MSNNDVKTSSGDEEESAQKSNAPLSRRKGAKGLPHLINGSLFENLKYRIRQFKRKIRGIIQDDYKGFFKYKQLLWRKRDWHRHFIWRRNITIGKDGRVHIPSVDFSLASECNLHCEYCSHFAPFRTGIASKESLIDSFEKWSRIIAPKSIVLTGGEPLLNPDIAEIVIAVHHHWQHSQRNLWTNGIILPQIPDDVLRIFEKYNVTLYISLHLDTDAYWDILAQSLSRLKQFRVRYTLTESFLDWRNVCDTDAVGVPVPSQSDPTAAYESCAAKRYVMVSNDYMYRCNYLAHMATAVQEGAIGPEWLPVLTHKPITFKSSPQEIRDYLLSGPTPECSVCPEIHSIVEARQLSVDDIQRIKLHIQQRLQQTT